MEIVKNVLVFLHVIGAVMVVGIWVANFKKGIVLPGQFHASLLQVITGFALYFMAMSNGISGSSYHMLVGIKMVIALIVAVAAYVGQKKYKAARSAGNLDAARSIPLAHTVGGLGLINIAIATIGGIS